MPVAQNGVPGSSLTVADIDWSRKQLIMSDSSRRNFGDKLTTGEVRGKSRAETNPLNSRPATNPLNSRF